MSPTTAVGLCLVCDAADGECSHTGARYLDPIEYVREGEGWSVPAGERERFERAPYDTDRTAQKPRSLDALKAMMRPYLVLDEALSALLEERYEETPLRVSLLVTEMVRGLEAGSGVYNPGGLLYRNLKQTH